MTMFRFQLPFFHPQDDPALSHGEEMDAPATSPAGGMRSSGLPDWRGDQLRTLGRGWPVVDDRGHYIALFFEDGTTRQYAKRPQTSRVVNPGGRR